MHLRLRLVAAALSAGIVLAGCSTPIAADEEPAALSATTTPADAPTTSPSASPSASPSGSPSPTEEARPPSSDGRLEKVETITGDISPKSVVASGTGLVFAQNMMYTHTVTVYDRDGELVTTIPDAVDLVAFGVDGPPGHLARCAGRGGVHPRRRVRLRLQLLDVRRRLRPRGQSTAARPSDGLPTELRVPGRHAHLRDRPGHRRSARCPSTSPSPPTAGTCSSPTGAPST